MNTLVPVNMIDKSGIREDRTQTWLYWLDTTSNREHRCSQPRLLIIISDCFICIDLLNLHTDQNQCKLSAHLIKVN